MRQCPPRGDPAALISVLMPVRDGGPRLAAAVASLLAQSDQRWECLLVDDHSADGALAALPVDARLRVLPNRGRGIVAALNTALAHSRGDLVARMDADDEMLPARLARQRAAFAADNALDALATRVEVRRDDGHPAPGMRAYVDWQNSLLSHRDIAAAMYAESPLVHPSMMIRRAALQRLGGYRPVRWPEDYDLWLRGLQAGWRFARLAEILLRWRDHDDRLTRTDPRCAPRMLAAARAHYLARGPLRGRRAVILGGGRQARWLGRGLLQQGVAVDWFVDINPRRIGGLCQGRPVRSTASLAALGARLALVAVTTPAARQALCQQLAAMGIDYLRAA